MRQMKDSGIEWIGQIPEEWETRQLKYAGIISVAQDFPLNIKELLLKFILFIKFQI